MDKIDYNPPLPIEISLKSKNIGIIIAHGERSSYNSGIIKAIARKVGEKKYSTIRFAFPFSVKGLKYNSKDSYENDQVLKLIYEYAIENYPEKKWILAGHGVAAESVIRMAPIIDDNGELPAIICLNYPLYPPNKPEKVEMRSLMGIIGQALMITGTESNRGDFNRMKNSLTMMADHVHMGRIGGANYEFKVKNKEDNTVAYWISNDIEKFIEEL